MSKKPLISVIITNYNYEKYVGQAIESVLNQTYENIELIIVNDGSSDNSDKVIKAYVKHNPGIIYINQKNHGVVYSRNKGMKRASGEYLCCLDADDFFNPDYIEKQYAWMIKSKADVVYANWNLLGDINQKVEFSEFNFAEYQKQHLHIKPESLIRASSIKQDNGKIKFGYLPETKERANDWAYFISLAANGLKFKHAKDNYINYRIKQGSMGSRLSRYEDVKIFYKYLVMFKKQYGEKIIDPIELPVDIIKQQDEHIKNLNIIIEDKDTIIKNKDDERKNMARETENLKQALDNIYNSQSWKVTKPLRVVNTFLHKRHSR